MDLLNVRKPIWKFKEINSQNDRLCLMDLLNVRKPIWNAINKPTVSEKASCENISKLMHINKS